MTESIEPTDKIVDDIVNNSSDEVTINYAQICDILPQGIVVQDTNGQIIYSNTSAEAILGLTADQVECRLILVGILFILMAPPCPVKNTRSWSHSKQAKHNRM